MEDFSRYGNPELASGLERLEVFRRERAKIALEAARHIVRNGGQTTDINLYYTAMFGRSYYEGISENDPNLLLPNEIASKLQDQKQGQPLLIRDVDFPDDNVDVGILASFSEETFQPIKFEVEIEDEAENFTFWQGRLAIAIKEVEPSGIKGFKLSDEVSKIVTCDTATWISNGTLEIHSKGTGGVEVGENMHRNSGRGGFRDKELVWLRKHLAPTQHEPLSEDLILLREGNRRRLKEAAAEQKVSEGRAAARGLSPTIAAFFERLKPYVGGEEPKEINIKELFAAWHDPYDARDLLVNLEVDDLVEEREGKLFLSTLGKDAMKYLKDLD